MNKIGRVIERNHMIYVINQAKLFNKKVEKFKKGRG